MTDNRYDTLFGNRSAPNARQQRGEELTRKYDAILPDREAQRAQINVLPDTNPDVAARANRYEREFGVPAAIAQDEIGGYDAMSRQRRVAAAAAEHPNIGRFMADPRAAAVAHDDTANLRAISRQFQAFWNKPEAPKPWTQRAREIASNIGGSLISGFYGAAEGVTQTLRAAGEIRQRVDPFSVALNALTGTPQRVQAAQDTYLRRTGEKAPDVLRDLIAVQRDQQRRNRPQGQSFVAGSLYAGVESVPTSLLALGSGLAGAPAAGLGAVGAISGGQSYGQARDEGLDPVRAGIYGAAQGGVETLTERIPVLKFLEDTKVGTPFFKRLARNLVAEQVGEQTATALQDFNQWATLDVNKGKTFGQYLKERPEAAAQTALAVAATVGTTNVAIEAGVRVTDKVQRVIAARDNASTLDRVIASAANSKLRGRDPESFRRFVEQSTENGEAENVYLPAEAVETYMQSEQFEDENGFFEGLRSQLDEARATGGDVVVPLADVATKLAGTPAWEALKDDARLQAGGLSAREAVREGEEVTRTLEQRGAEIVAAAESEAAQAEPAAAVYDEVRQQLVDIGFTQQAASHQAALYAASREAWGKRLGVDALAYHRANPVEFRRGEYDASSAQRVMDQVSPEQAMELNTPLDLPTDPLFGEAVSNTPGAEVTPEGLRVELVRVQKADQEGAQSIRTGVFYLPKGSANLRHYKGPSTAYGGTDKFEGPTLLRRPLFVKGATGGKAPEAAFDQIRGKGAMKELEPKLYKLFNAKYKEEAVAELLDEYGADSNLAYEIVQNSKQGNQLRYAVQENIIAHTVREAGYDAVVGYSKGKAGASISEVFDVREQTYPARGMDSEIHDAYYQGTGSAAPRGQIALYGDRSVITLFENADLSTLIHETGHLFLEELQKNAEAPGAPADVVADWETVKKWFVDNGVALDTGNVVGTLPRQGVAPAFLGKDGKVYTGASGTQHFSAVSETLRAVGIDDTGFVTPEGTFLNRADALTYVLSNGEKIKPSENMQGELDALDYREQSKFARRLDNDVQPRGTIPREAHELWARGFERYAMEGKAPSSALQAAFTAFRGWLLRIYEVVSRLRSPINPEIRQVMDRMLATQDAIDAYSDEQNARALFTDAAQAGMTEAEFDAYQKTVVQARDDAYDALLFRTMARIKQQRERRVKEETRVIRDEAETAIADEPRFKALRLLRTGKIGDQVLPVKLDRTWLVMRYGEDIEGRLPANVRIGERDTTFADDIAEMTGFSSGAEMIEALLDIQSQTRAMRLLGDKRQLRDKLIDDAVDAAVVDAGLRDPLTDGSIEEEAIAAINNERQGEVISSEARALARRTNAKPTPYKLAREWARRKIEAGRVNDVASRSAMQRYARATAKAARLAETAILEGNIDEAFRQKQAQMLNHALLVEAKAAADEIDSVVARMGKLAKRAAMQSVDQDYFDRVHALLEGYSFRAASQKGLDELEGFREWAEQRAAAGFEVFVPPRLATATQHYSRVTVEELFGLRDAVDSLMALGRHKQKLLDGQRERDFAEVVKGIVGNLRQLPDRVLPKMFNETTAKPLLDRGRQALRDWTAGGLKISTLALEMDVQDPNGPMMNLLVHRATEAENKRARLRDLVLIPLAKQYTDMSAKEQRRLDELVTIPELTYNVGLSEDDPRLGQPLVVTRKELLAIALNTGNASNFEKMTRGERWPALTVRDVLNRELTKDDWQFVQAMWDGVERLWPSIVETERSLSGVVPEKVTALPIETPHGIFAGGYWPVVYDSDRSGVAEKNADKQADDMFGKRSGLGTPKGHTITRTEAIGPMTYSLDRILLQHLEKVITRLAYAQYARDVVRVIGNDQVRGAIDLKLGREYRRQIEPWLQRQIVSYVNVDGAKFMEKILRYTRQGITVVGMGLRWSTGVAQISGLTASLARLGAKQTPRLVNNMRRTLMAIPAMAAGGNSEVHDFVFSRSEQMQRRLRESNVEIDTAFRKLAGRHSYMDTVSAWAMWHIGMIDLHIVSIPTWLTGYQKAINEGMTDAQASSYADQMVVTSQGGGRAKDLSNWQAPASEAQKLFVMFYTPFNVLFNAQWEAARGVKRQDWTKAANLTFFFLVAQMLTDALLSGDWPKEDKEDPEGMPLATIKWAARNVGFGMFSGIPFARDAATYAERSMIGQYATFGGTPLARIFEDMTRSAETLYKVQQGEKEFTPDAVPGIANTVGALTHTPLGQPGQTTKFLWQYQRGEVEPQSVGDWYTGLTKGKIDEGDKR